MKENPTGIDLIGLMKQHLGERYVLGAVAPKDDPNYHGAWDCAELCSWAVFQLIQELYGCVNHEANPRVADAYTGSWKYDSDNEGIIIPVKDAAVTAGAFLLRYSGGTIGHIVISQGDGTTVEAHSSNKGVIEHVVNGRRWDRGILIPTVDYNVVQNVPPQKETRTLRWTQPLMYEEAIKAFQLILIRKGYSVGKWGADGYYGSATAQAVRAFQRDAGLVCDGEIGEETAYALGLAMRN